MSTSWRAADIAPTERVDSFAHFVGASLVPYSTPTDILLEDDNEIRTADVGSLRVMRFNWTHGIALRSANDVRQSDPELCKIDLTMTGRFAIEQSDRQAVLGPGTFTLIDLSRPHQVAARRSDMTVAMFPRALLPFRDKDINDLAGTTFDRSHPGSALVTSVVGELTGNLDAYEGPAGARIGNCVLDLIVATLAARLDRTWAVPWESRQRTLVLRIRAFIDAHLSDPALAPSMIADHHHISPRLLHKLFVGEGTTVAGLIRARRLDNCRRDLLNPAYAIRTVASVAAAWGFRDAAYFSRVFNAEYGMAPGEYRRMSFVPPDVSAESAAHPSTSRPTSAQVADRG